MLSAVLSIVLIGLVGVHFYWAFGGSKGINAAIPTDSNGNKIFNPTRMASASVGFGLLAMALFYLEKDTLVSM